MLTRMSHVCIFVLDQDKAKEFYTKKLGFEVITEAPMDEDVKWLTLGLKDQPGFEIVLTGITNKMMFNDETAAAMRDLVSNGTFGFGVFECDDIYATYEELKAKGVEFKKPPSKEFYGMEAIFKDDSGSWFSLGEKAK